MAQGITMVELKCQHEWPDGTSCSNRPTHLVYDDYECAGSYCKDHAEEVMKHLQELAGEDDEEGGD